MNYKTTVYLIVLLFNGFYSQGQNINNPPQKYRVVAVNNQDENVISVSNEINIYLPMNIFFPRAFSPNGDGLNDTFGPVGEGIEAFHFTIFNRWGELVFQSKNISLIYQPHIIRIPYELLYLNGI